jgi:hypothetical protein
MRVQGAQGMMAVNERAPCITVPAALGPGEEDPVAAGRRCTVVGRASRWRTAEGTASPRRPGRCPRIDGPGDPEDVVPRLEVSTPGTRPEDVRIDGRSTKRSSRASPGSWRQPRRPKGVSRSSWASGASSLSAPDGVGLGIPHRHPDDVASRTVTRSGAGHRQAQRSPVSGGKSRRPSPFRKQRPGAIPVASNRDRTGTLRPDRIHPRPGLVAGPRRRRRWGGPIGIADGIRAFHVADPPPSLAVPREGRPENVGSAESLVRERGLSIAGPEAGSPHEASHPTPPEWRQGSLFVRLEPTLPPGSHARNLVMLFWNAGAARPPRVPGRVLAAAGPGPRPGSGPSAVSPGARGTGA